MMHEQLIVLLGPGSVLARAKQDTHCTAIVTANIRKKFEDILNTDSLQAVYREMYGCKGRSQKGGVT